MPDQSLENAKKVWESKTFWVNIVAGGAMLAQMRWGFVISPETQAVVLSLINIGLRKITKDAITW